MSLGGARPACLLLARCWAGHPASPPAHGSHGNLVAHRKLSLGGAVSRSLWLQEMGTFFLGFSYSQERKKESSEHSFEWWTGQDLEMEGGKRNPRATAHVNCGRWHWPPLSIAWKEREPYRGSSG